MTLPKIKITAPKIAKISRESDSPKDAIQAKNIEKKPQIADIRERNLATKRRMINRRPSTEIAKSFVELNLKTIIDVEENAKLSPRERKKLERANKKATKKHHPLRNAIIAILILAILAIGSAIIWWQNSTQPVNRIDKNNYRFEVSEGATTNEIATALHKANFIRNPLAFKIYVRLNGGIIQAGTHMLSPSSDLFGIADKLSRAETEEIDIQIPPGLSLNQLRETFKEYDFTDEKITAAFNAKYKGDILRDKPENASIEGYIYPDTYRVYAGDNLEKVIQMAIDEMEKVAKKNDLKEKFAAQGLNFHEGLTLASIIEKEVVSDNDRKNVAQVFFNRMAAGWNLGADATFRYAFTEKLCEIDSPDCDSEYNTRIHAGLPPGPISNVDLSALLAVANPEDNNYFFYVSGDDGTTHFSETQDQHNSAIAEYCQILCQ